MLGNLVKYKSIVYNYRRPLQELMAPYFVIHQKSEDTHLQLYSRNVQKLFLKWSRETERRSYCNIEEPEADFNNFTG
ncbi:MULTISPECIES: hypothetical protein [Prevotellaceae]|uniref:hypothetical protein n=1 Tax=Prevotellaceae TaxID=171552 RepID=UPI0012B59608|nr:MULTISPECIES: hypothetical protein [Prevotellaceae]